MGRAGWVQSSVSGVVVVLLSMVGAASAAAQRLSLGEALARADLGAYANRMAGGESAARRAGALAAVAGVLPSVRLESGYLRTTDPVSAFGLALRQRRATAADFDPTRLNDPAAAGGYASAVVVEAPLFNADAWQGRAAAGRSAAAAELTERWTREGTRAQVVEGYWGAVLAAEQEGTLEAALRAAREHVRAASSLVANGLATRSDALLAEVKADEVEARLAGARGDARVAKRALAVLMGTPEDTSFTLPQRLPGAEGIRSFALANGALPVDAAAPAGDSSRASGSAGALKAAPPGGAVPDALLARADVQAARAGVRAAESDRWRARSRLLPRLNSFARYDWNAPGSLYGGRKSWTVGVMGSWTPFPGAADVAELKGAAARTGTARAAAEGALAQARLEAEKAQTAVAVSLERLAIAERSVTQAAEAHRLVSRKYSAGLATVVEVLDAAAAETQARLALSGARYDALAALAGQRHALGQDPAGLVDLENGNS